MTDKSNPDGEFGEGNYKAAQHYREAQEDFAADKAKVKDKAREAADALDGAEGEALEKARQDSAKGAGHA